MTLDTSQLFGELPFRNTCSALRAAFVEPHSALWKELLAEVNHDFTQLPQFADLSARKEQGQAAAFFAEQEGSRLLIPLIVRRVSPDIAPGQPLFDVTCPYGYPGVVLRDQRDHSQAFLECALNAFVAGLRRLNVVAAFFRLHPILEVPLEPLAKVGTLIRHGETLSVDLRLSSDEIWRQTRKSHRRDIKRAEKLGYAVRMDEKWQTFDAFVEMYHRNMRRVRANDFYFFSRGYLAELRTALGDRLHLCVVERSGRLAAACLVTEVCGIVTGYLSATQEEFLSDSPCKIIDNFLPHWAKERGNVVLHLGGGVGGQRDSLFEYKAGFARVCKPFYTWRIIPNKSIYQMLTQRWEDRSGVQADRPEGFFPAYRKLLPEA